MFLYSLLRMTIEQIQTYVEWLSFSCVIPFVAGLLLYNRTRQGTRLFIWYLGYETLKQLFLLLSLKYFHLNTLFITHLSSILVPIVFMVVLIPREYFKSHRPIVYLIFGFAVIYFGMDLATNFNLNRFSVHPAIFSSLVIVIAGVIRLNHIRDNSHLKPTMLPIFWIAICATVYYLTNAYFYHLRQVYLELFLNDINPEENLQKLANVQFLNMVVYAGVYMVPIAYGLFRIKWSLR